MADIAQLGIAVDTSQTKIAARELDNLASAGGRAEASTKKLESTARKSMADIAAATQRSQQALERMAAAQERQEKLAEQMARQMNEFARATNAGTGATNAMAQASNNAAQALGKQSAAARDAQASIGEMTGRLLATVAAVVSLNDAVSRMDAWTVMNNRLKLVTDTQTQFAQAQSNIIDIANSTQQPIAETAELYQRLASSQKTLGLSGTELAGIVKTISQSMVVGGTTAAGGAAALMQLGQAFNSGVLRGEEFNSVMEQAPGLMQALAAGMGKTVGEMRALAEAGKITTQEIVKALQSQSDEVQSSFDKMTGTIGGAMNVAKNGLTELIGRMNDATGAGSVLSAAIIGVGENMGAVATGAATLAAVGLATWFTSAATAAGGFAVAATAVGTAMKGLMVSMGPAGWLILALGTAATAWQLFGDKAQTAGRQTETAADKANAAANKLVAGIVPAINTAIAAYDKMIEKQKQAAGTAATPIQQAAAGLKEADLNLQRLAQQAARAQQGIGEYAQMSAADRMRAEKAVTAELEKASLKRAELAKKEAEYNSGVVSAYVKGKERQTDASARLLQIEEAKGKRDAALAAAGNDRAKQEAVQAAYRVELAKIDESYSKKGASTKTAAARAAKVALKDETDALSDLAGLSSTYYKDLENYQKQRAKGTITEAQYVELVEKLIQKQPFAIKLAKEQAEAWKEQEKARKEAYDAIEKAYEDETKASERSAQQVTDRVAQIQIENEAADIAATTNLSLAQAIEQVMIARLEEQAVIARDEGKQEVLDALNAEIEARKQLASVTGQKEAREANAKAAKDAAEEWKRTADKIEDSLIDALMNGGKSGAEYIEGLFRSMVLRPVLQAIVSPVAGAVTSALGFSGAAQAGQGGGELGGVGTLKTAYDAITTGIRSSIASGFEKLVTNGVGEKLGLSYYDGNAYQTTGLGEQFSGVAQGLGSTMTAYGLQKSLSGGYQTGASGLVDAATAIGGFFDPTGGLIAGAIGGTVNRAFGRKLKDQGLEGTFGTADGFDGNAYQDYKGGWFRSDKTKRQALDAGVEDTLEAQFKALQTQTAMMAQTLGLGADSVAEFTAKIKVSFKGLSEEQISERMAEEFGKLGNEMAAAALGTMQTVTETVLEKQYNPYELDEDGRYTFEMVEKTVQRVVEVQSEYARNGETAAETLSRLSGSLVTVNGTFDVLGQTLYASSLVGADMASQLVDLMGGQEAFINTTATYYDAFYTEAERTETATRQLTQALSAIGVDTLPATREAFRSLVEAQDLTTESGRATYAGLLGVSDAFAALVPTTEVAADAVETIEQAYRRLTNVTFTAEQAAEQRIGLEEQLLQLQGNTAALRARELAALDPTNHALQESIWALEDLQAEATAMAQAVQDAITAQQDYAAAVQSTQDALTSAQNALVQATDAVTSVQNQATSAYLSAKDREAAAIQQIADLQAQTQRDLADAVRQSNKELQDMADTLRGFVFGEMADPSRQFGDALAKALGGDKGAMASLPDLARSATEAATLQAGSALEARRAQAEIMRGVLDAAAVAETAIAVVPDAPGQEDPLVAAQRELTAAQMEVADALRVANAIQAPLTQSIEDLIAAYNTAKADEAAAAAEVQAAQAALDAIKTHTWETWQATKALDLEIEKMHARAQLNVSAIVDTVINAELPPELEVLALGSKDALQKTINATITSTALTPELKLLALEKSEAIAKTVNAAIKSTDLTTQLKQLAIGTSGDLSKTVNGIITSTGLTTALKQIGLETAGAVNKTINATITSSDLTPELKLLALESTDDIAKTVNAAIKSTDLTTQLKTLAIGTSGDLSKTVNGIITSTGLTTALKQIGLEAAGAVNKTINATITSSDLTPELKLLALDKTDAIAKTVNAAIKSTDLTTQLKTLAIGTSGDLSKTVNGIITSTGLTTALKQIGLEAAGAVNKTINATITSTHLTPELKLLALESTGAINKLVTASIETRGELGDDVYKFLNLQATDLSKVLTTVLENSGNLSPDVVKFVSWTASDVSKTLTAAIANKGVLGSDAVTLIGLASDGITKTLQAAITNSGALSTDAKTLVASSSTSLARTLAVTISNPTTDKNVAALLATTSSAISRTIETTIKQAGDTPSAITDLKLGTIAALTKNINTVLTNPVYASNVPEAMKQLLAAENIVKNLLPKINTDNLTADEQALITSLVQNVDGTISLEAGAGLLNLLQDIDTNTASTAINTAVAAIEQTPKQQAELKRLQDLQKAQAEAQAAKAYADALSLAKGISATFSGRESYRYQTGGKNFEDGVSVAGVYGNIGMNDRGSYDITASQYSKTFQGIAKLDAAIAATLSPEQNAKIKTALNGYVSDQNESVADYVSNRLGVIQRTVGTGASPLVEKLIQDLGGVPAFHTGGYTGPGGKYEPAGIVHAGEVVWSQADVERWGGWQVVDAMRNQSPEDLAATNRSGGVTMVDNSAIVVELRELRVQNEKLVSEVRKLQADTQATAVSSSRTTDLLKRVTRNGEAMQTEALA